MKGDRITTILPGKVCVSCGRLTHEYTEFKCPSCGDSTVIRDKHCREITNIYRCPKCGFEGP